MTRLEDLLTRKCVNCSYFHTEQGCLLLADAHNCIQNGYAHFTPRFTQFAVDIFKTLSENYCRKDNE